jgi:hypothetical protein
MEPSYIDPFWSYTLIKGPDSIKSPYSASARSLPFDFPVISIHIIAT